MECDGNYHTIFSDIYDTDGARTRRIRRRCTCQMCVYSDDCPTRTLTLREMLTINLSHRIERALAYKDDVCISITHNCWANCLDQWGSIYFRHLYLVASNSKNVLTLMLELWSQHTSIAWTHMSKCADKIFRTQFRDWPKTQNKCCLPTKYVYSALVNKHRHHPHPCRLHWNPIIVAHGEETLSSGHAHTHTHAR